MPPPPKDHKRNLGLYIALLCIVGILVIFFIDAYLGIYDTLTLKIGEREYPVSFDRWERGGAYIPATSYGEPVSFEYQIANHGFREYPTPVEASVWKSEEKILDLFKENESVKPFGDVVVRWTLETERLKEHRDSVARYTEYTVKIATERTERKIVLQVGVEAMLAPPNAIPVPLRG